MYLEQFIYLQAIAQYQSLNAAAESLFISHQALSRSIHNFEKELDCTLLQRNSRGVVFTPEGQYILSIALRINDAIEELNNFKKEKANQLQGAITVLCNQQEYDFFFSRVLSFFYKNYPALTINHDIAKNLEMVQILNRHEADVGICNFTELDGQINLELPSNLILEEFNREKLGVIFSKDFPLAKYKKVSLKTLRRYPVIINASHEDDATKTPALFLLKPYGQIKTLTAATEVMYMDFLENGLGYALCPYSASKELNCSFCSLQEKAYAVRAFITNKEEKTSMLRELFIDIYKKLFST